MRILRLLSIALLLFTFATQSFAKNATENIVFDLIKQKKWQQAYDIANKAKNLPLKKIVLSQQFLDNKYHGNNFEKIADFLLHNPDWADSSSIQITAESLLNENINPSIIVKFFSKNSPITGQGYKYYAIAASKLLIKSPRLPEIIKLGWHKGNFSATEQKAYYQKHKSMLTKEDNIKKIDYNLLKEKITVARNCYYLVEEGYKKSFEAQIAFIQNKQDSFKQFKNIEQKYYTPGLIYQYIKTQKQLNPPSVSLVNLINIAKADKIFGDKIWEVQNYLAREYIEKKKYNDAYKIISCHFANNAGNRSEAEFLSGWLSLRFLHQPEKAIKHFQHFNNIVKTPISKSRGLYWLARAYEDTHKEKAKSKELYKLAATKYPYTFYGQLAAMEINLPHISLPEDINLKKQLVASTKQTSKNHLLQATKIVSAFGSNALAKVYIQNAVEKANTADEITNLASTISHDTNVHHAAWLGKHALQKHVVLSKHSYPVPYKIANLPLEIPFIYSIIRQESVFDQHAISSAQAKGLMQLLDDTACNVAKYVEDKCVVSNLTKNPLYNIKLGSHYLSKLIDTYDGSYILAIAAYNGGPRNINKWLDVYGDPRTMKNHRSVIDWLELIPFYETRNYVQRVLENLQIYRTIINKNKSLVLKKDLVLRLK